MMIACIVPITCIISSEETTNIALVLFVRVKKMQFGGKRAFFAGERQFFSLPML